MGLGILGGRGADKAARKAGSSSVMDVGVKGYVTAHQALAHADEGGKLARVAARVVRSPFAWGLLAGAGVGIAPDVLPGTGITPIGDSTAISDVLEGGLAVGAGTVAVKSGGGARQAAAGAALALGLQSLTGLF